jgi:exoribonuclease R
MSLRKLCTYAMFLPFHSKNALRGPYSIGDTLYKTAPPPTLVPGDLVHSDTGEVKRVKHKPIVGIVDLLNRTRYGFNSRGIPLYMFHPLDSTYPPMIVGSRQPPTSNFLAIGSYEPLQGTEGSGKWLRGSLQGFIGSVGNPEAEQDGLRRSITTSTKKPTAIGYDVVANIPADIREEQWDMTMNIDPDGCRDVDDVLSWRTIAEGGTEFAISIADVASWVPQSSELDEFACERGQTVYEDGRVLESMLPAEISEGKASLLSDGHARPVISCVWKITSGGIVGPQWRHQVLINQRTHTYESILDDADSATTICRCLEAILGRSVGNDPHVWIEYAMVLYNTEAAKILRRLGRGILRRHASPVLECDRLLDIANKTGCRAIAFLGYSAGEYVAATERGDVSHAGLGAVLYCHASSPLRRYADLVNQRVIHMAIQLCGEGLLPPSSPSPSPSPSSSPEELLSRVLNNRARRIKRFERELWCVQHLRSDAISTATGTVVGWSTKVMDEQALRLAVYVPEWNRLVRLTLWMDAEAVAEENSVAVRSRDLKNRWNLRKGDSVEVEAYTDLREVCWASRYVFGLRK